MADFYLLRFVDGPLAGAMHRADRTVYSWPLPKRLVFLGQNAEGAGLMDADSGAIFADDAIYYEKMSESQLPNDDSPFLARGAVYRLETTDALPL